MSLISLLILVIVFGLIFYCIDLLPVDGRFKQIAKIILIIIAIVALLQVTGLVGGHLLHL